MKLRLMICAAAAGTALFAEDVTSATYGVLAVSESTVSNVVVGVPWRGITESEPMTDITLSNLVSTATLAENDIVYLYEDGKWYGYSITASGGWNPMTTIGTNTVTSAGAADVKTMARGSGLVIQRASSVTPIYLCGRYDETAPSATSISANSTTLIANPKTVAVNITAGNTGDEIRVPGNGGTMTVYEKRDDGWYGTVTNTTFGFPVTRKQKLSDGVPLGAGKGAFYVSKGAACSISW